ncbi:hypothetical protein AB0Q95_37440 [Streptomyces sp. NPDC059900]|uniref:hypothetical protein n=1 Tax=Streptomyces sp. NPDC059900 TaxID=3155816 RepID=UPI00342CCC5E
MGAVGARLARLGLLVRWSGWKLAFTLYLALAQPADAAMPESLAFAAVLHLAAVGAGAAVLCALLRTRLVSQHP